MKNWLAFLLATVSGAAMAQVTYTWTDVTPDGVFVETLAIHPHDGKRLLVLATESPATSQTLRTSTDGGLTWKSVASPPQNLFRGHRLYAHLGLPGVVFLQTDGNFFQPGVGDAIFSAGTTYRSDDFGATWHVAFAATGKEFAVSPFASDPFDVNRIFATLRTPSSIERMTFGTISGEDSTVATSGDGGRTWSLPGTGLPQLTAYIPFGKTFSPFDSADGPSPAAPARLFFTAGFTSAPPVTYVSTDSGASWKPFDTGAIGPFIWVRQDPRNANVLYALRQPNPFPGLAQVIRSDDGGRFWTSALEVHDQDRFELSGVGPNLAIDPTRPRNLWIAGLTDGVVHSADGGQTWTNEGFAGPANDTKAAVWIDVADPGVVYVLHKRRLFRGTAPVRPDPVIVEFRYENDRYWLTSLDGEALSQDYRLEPGNVRRTGLRWGAWRADDAPAGAVGSCRFWPKPQTGLRTRVVVLQGFECDALKRNPDGWILEGENEFFAVPPTLGGCAGGLVPVHRFHNLKADANHRWVADAAAVAEMRTRGWYDEGVRFCARPLDSFE